MNFEDFKLHKFRSMKMSTPHDRPTHMLENSYIGTHVRDYLLQTSDSYIVEVKNTMGWTPETSDFAGTDAVINVAGIAHIKETKENRNLFYEVNRDLAVNIARKAKEAGVRQYILLSTMSVYGKTEGHITKETPPAPTSAYARSKAEADEIIKELGDDSFLFACLRPPMVYGRGCRGNYQKLRKLCLKLPLFPKLDNARSMIYIGNLCEFVRDCIDNEKHGLFFPQNEEYVNTTRMAQLIASEHGKKIRLTRAFNPAIRHLPIGAAKKAFGTLTYEKTDTVGKYGFEESIKLTEE